MVWPTSRSWDEGNGRALNYSDLDAANWITSSISSAATAVTWSISGSGEGNYNGSETADYITGSEQLGSLEFKQFLQNGTEDISIDVSRAVSASLANLLINEGFRLSLSESHEKANNSFFVLRYASRHSTNPNIVPRLYVRFNDAIQDYSNNFFFDLSGSIFLKNTHFGQPANLLSGSSLSQITGLNSLLLKLESGSFSKIITASQHQINGNNQKGLYSASFAISSEENSALRQEIRSAGSASFNIVWSDLTQTQPFLSSSLVIKEINRTSFDDEPNQLIVNITNMRSEYSQSEVAFFRVKSFNVNEKIKASKVPIERKSLVFQKIYYQVRDAISDEIIIPFDSDGASEVSATLCSSDAEGNSFKLWISDLALGRTYTIDFKIKDLGTTQEFRTGQSFRVIA